LLFYCSVFSRLQSVSSFNKAFDDADDDAAAAADDDDDDDDDDDLCVNQLSNSRDTLQSTNFVHFRSVSRRIYV